MFDEKKDYIFESFDDFNNAYGILKNQGESLFSPGYFVNKYKISRQLINNWVHRDSRIRQLTFRPLGASKNDCFIFIPESDIIEVFESSRVKEKNA